MAEMKMLRTATIIIVCIISTKYDDNDYGNIGSNSYGVGVPVGIV